MQWDWEGNKNKVCLQLDRTGSRSSQRSQTPNWIGEGLPEMVVGEEERKEYSRGGSRDGRRKRWKGKEGKEREKEISGKGRERREGMQGQLTPSHMQFWIRPYTIF